MAVDFLHGAVSMGCAAIGWFFARFWRHSVDRFFLFFAIAFWTLAIDYAVLGLIRFETEWRVSVYAVRLVAFCVILYGIVDKNRSP